jgi:Domain of unknown function (DUF4349)
MKRTALSLIVVVLALPLTAVGCAKKNEPAWMSSSGSVRQDAQGFDEQAKQQAPNAAGGPKEKERAPVERKIIYTANVHLIVADFAKGEQELHKLVQASKGYFAKEETSGTAGSTQQGTWKVRIPTPKFSEFREAIKKIGELVRYSSDANEVTEEYFDLQVRIKNKEVEVQTMRNLYDKFDGKPQDMTPLVREVSRVTEELERLKGRQRLLDNLTELTTVTVQMQQRGSYVPPEPPEMPTFGSTVERTFSGSIAALVEVGKAVVLVAVALGPWLPVVALVAVPIWWNWRRNKTAMLRPKTD